MTPHPPRFCASFCRSPRTGANNLRKAKRPEASTVIVFADSSEWGG
jgi:hypothetical protein